MRVPAHRTASASHRSSRAAGRVGEAVDMQARAPGGARGCDRSRVSTDGREPATIAASGGSLRFCATIRRQSPLCKGSMQPTPTRNLSAEAPPAGRPRRADAQRNVERLIAAARTAFAENGPNASLDDIARAAGVGPGTLYSHFPTRLALFEAVYRDSVERLCAEGDRLATSEAAGPALIDWLQ